MTALTDLTNKDLHRFSDKKTLIKALENAPWYKGHHTKVHEACIYFVDKIAEKKYIPDGLILEWIEAVNSVIDIPHFLRFTIYFYFEDVLTTLGLSEDDVTLANDTLKSFIGVYYNNKQE